MTPQFQYKKLEQVAQALFDDSEESPEAIRAEMRSKGYDPDALAARIQAVVKQMSARSRLSWMAQADAVQASFDRTMAKMRSWATRSRKEIEKAFEDARVGRFGAGAQARLATAFNNVTEITTETKAAFLDDIQALAEMDKSADETNQP